MITHLPIPSNHLDRPLSQLDPFWLVIGCKSCGSIVYQPIKLLRQKAGDIKLADIFPKLVCSKCKTGSPSVGLTNRPDLGREGYGGGIGEWIDLAT